MTQHTLKVPDAFAHRRLRHEQRRRGTTEAAVLPYGKEHTQVLEIQTHK